LPFYNPTLYHHNRRRGKLAAEGRPSTISILRRIRGGVSSERSRRGSGMMIVKRRRTTMTMMRVKMVVVVVVVAWSLALA